MKKTAHYFTRTEIILWSVSAALIISSFLIFDRVNHLTLCASIIGVTALIFNAKGNPAGQALMIVFSIMYGIISMSFAYYGEMITYLGMTMPMAVVSLISWVRNTYDKNKSEVRVNRISRREIIAALIATAAVTAAFFFNFKGVQHSKSYPKHHLGDYEHSRGISDVPQKPVVRRRLCRQ